jgi:aspartate kinase
MTTLIMKFGGASTAKPESFAKVAEIIMKRQEEYSKVVVVVSAMGDTTNELIALAKQVNPSPPRRELDMLISVGERISISLLAMALALKGKEAISLTGSQSGIITSSEHFDARILAVKPLRILKHLEEGKIVIVAGFQGVSTRGEITTLGRGGSDTSAVALAVALGAVKVEFFKDVEGIYPKDPKECSESVPYFHLDYLDALRIIRKGARVLHDRSLELAEQNRVALHVLSFKTFGEDEAFPGTIISSEKEKPREAIYEKEA